MLLSTNTKYLLLSTDTFLTCNQIFSFPKNYTFIILQVDYTLQTLLRFELSCSEGQLSSNL